MSRKLLTRWSCEQLYYSELIEKKIIQRPDFQRLLDEDRVKKMTEAFLENCSKKNYLETVEEITIAVSTDCTWILDGQHRLECFKNLYQYHNIDVPIDTRSIKVKNINEANKWFSIVNLACPMPQLPEGMTSYAKPNELYHLIMERFPQNPRRGKNGLFDTNQRAKPPRMHKTNFITEIATQLNKNPMTKDMFLSKVIKFNNEVKEKVEEKEYDYFKSKGLNWTTTTFKRQFDTCEKDCGEFYLGIFRKHMWVKMIFENKDIRCELKKKTKIPKYIKDQVWYRHNRKQFDVPCPICKNAIMTPFNFEAGHIISEYNGGKAVLDNLIPLCSRCNKSIGTKNIKLK